MALSEIRRWLCAQSDACIAVSNSEYQRILKHKIVSEQKLFTILNGVTVAQKKHTFVMKKRIICILRDDPAKNPDLVIRIAKLLITNLD